MKKPTVTVAVSAYNEEKNIIPLLKSVQSQKQKSFTLKKILIISDGSTDNTAKLIKSLKSKLVILKEYRERKGLPSRLNEICKNLTSDYLVKTDADVVFSHSEVIEELIKAMIIDNKIGMCAGNTQPLKGITFTEKAINTTHPIYSNFRKILKDGNNWFSASGRLFALSKELAEQMVFPIDVIGGDRFAYLTCLTLGYKYKYAVNAIVNFRSAQTLKDHIAQNTRFLAIPIRMAKYFDKELVYTETHIPTSLLLKSLAIQFIKHPVLSGYIFLVNRYCKLKAIRTEKNMSAHWEIAASTKRLLA